MLGDLYDADTLSDVLNIIVSQLGPRPLCQSVLVVLGFVTPSAFMASAAGSYDLMNQILFAADAAVIQWRKCHN